MVPQIPPSPEILQLLSHILVLSYQPSPFHLPSLRLAHFQGPTDEDMDMGEPSCLSLPQQQPLLPIFVFIGNSRPDVLREIHTLSQIKTEKERRAVGHSEVK